MLRRRQEKKIHVEKELSGVLVPIWCRRTTSMPRTRRRRSHRRTKQRLSRQPRLRRRRKEFALCARVRITLLHRVRIAKAKSLLTWSLARLGEHRGTVIHYLQFFQFVIHLTCGLTRGLIFMYVLIFLYFLLIRSEGLPPCCWETAHMRVFLVLVWSI